MTRHCRTPHWEKATPIVASLSDIKERPPWQTQALAVPPFLNLRTNQIQTKALQNLQNHTIPVRVVHLVFPWHWLTRVADMSEYTAMSASSTPSRPGVTGIENPNLTNVMPQLREDLSNKFSTGNSLTDFVHHIYGVPMDVIAFILDANRQLTLPDLTAYRTASPEPEMYRPFEDIANFLLGQAIDEVNTFLGQDPANAEQSIVFWSALGTRALESSLTTRKPDMLTTNPDDIRARPLWLLVWQVFEFKRKAAKLEESGNQQAISSHSSAFTSSGSVFSSSAHALPTIPAASQSLTASNAKASGSKISHTKAPKERFDDAEFNPRAPSAGSKKRKGSHSSTSTSASKRARQGPAPPMPPPPPPPPPSLTNDQLQLATYALECLDASTRHYVTGVWIDRFQISMWYFDRACIIQTVKFDFEQTPAYLILILYALHTCRDSEKAGFDPNLTLLPRAERSQRPSKKKTPKHYQDVLGAVITLPAPLPLPSDIKIPDNIQLPSPGNVLGDHCTILETLFAYRGLIGRGTMVYKVAPPPTPACPNPDPLAAKFSWPLRIRQLEAFTIERLRARLPPKWHEHIPEVVMWTIRTAEQLGLPRVELLKIHPIAGFEDRISHAIVMKLYGKLWEVGSVEAFMDVWVHCLECESLSPTDIRHLLTFFARSSSFLCHWSRSAPRPEREQSHVQVQRRRSSPRHSERLGYGRMGRRQRRHSFIHRPTPHRHPSLHGHRPFG
ncbi:hypothetical protein DXG03_001847 [Asterophora parasitica]|uniref:Fungal-type protein kinase domain-containing protein n=1 Tax=Asterophora parasitica TaxID=117018 RepID=A0A9P7G3T0_9AGAR|nr:hypothetical protein DXG03_001847 [Asterophora parasitica]